MARIEQVLLGILDASSLDNVFSLVDRDKVEIPDDMESMFPSPNRISLLLDAISQYALLDRHVYNAQDGRSCVSLKWEKTLIEQHAPGASNVPLH